MFSGTTLLCCQVDQVVNVCKQTTPTLPVSEVDGRLLGDSEAWLQAGGQGRYVSHGSEADIALWYQERKGNVRRCKLDAILLTSGS